MLTLCIFALGCEKMHEPNIGENIHSDKCSFSITIDDVNEYLNCLKKDTPTKVSSVRVEPLINKNDTVMYLVNYDEGWELLSGDRRVSRVLAKCEKGQTSINDMLQNETFASYYYSLSEGLYNIRHDEGLSVPEGMDDTWEKLSETEEENGRGHLDSMIVKVLISSISQTWNLKIKDHLLETKWGQGSPWNKSAPFRYSTKISRCYTGCVMVSAAQVLYYMYATTGYPQCTYGHAFCDAFIPDAQDSLILSSSQISFSQYSNHWSEMPLTSSDTTGTYRVAALMSWIGYNYGAKYKRNGTSSRTDKATTWFPYLFGITCQKYDIVQNGIDGFVSLVDTQVYSNSKPVMMSVRQSTDDSGHSIVIDGYRHTRTKTTNEYAYYITGPDGRIPFWQQPDSYGTEYVYSDNKYVAINWGWNGSCDSEPESGTTIWYNIYNDWIVSSGNYDVKSYAIYGFSH